MLGFALMAARRAVSQSVLGGTLGTLGLSFDGERDLTPLPRKHSMVGGTNERYYRIVDGLSAMGYGMGRPWP